MDVKQDVRREWFLEFAHWFTQEFASAFSLTPYADWESGASEQEWRAFARDAEGHEVSANLPHNFPWFRPLPVAKSVVVRLLDQVMQKYERPSTADIPRVTPSRRTPNA